MMSSFYEEALTTAWERFVIRGRTEEFIGDANRRFVSFQDKACRSGHGLVDHLTSERHRARPLRCAASTAAISSAQRASSSGPGRTPVDHGDMGRVDRHHPFVAEGAVLFGE